MKAQGRQDDCASPAARASRSTAIAFDREASLRLGVRSSGDRMMINRLCCRPDFWLNLCPPELTSADLR